MKLSNLSLKQPLLPVPNSIVIIALVVALVGFADATYLTIEHFRNVIPPCTTSGCEEVLTSGYSVVAGVPVSLGGAIYYLLVMVGLFAYLDAKNLKLLKAVFLFTVVGLLASLWFIYVQAFILGAYCQYCLVSAGTSTLLFLIGAFVLAKYSDNQAGIQ